MSPTNTTADAERLAVNAEWFAKLRWVAALGQLLVILFASGPLGIELPTKPLLLLVGITAISNLFFWQWQVTFSSADTFNRKKLQAVLIGLMLLDLVVLTAMLWLTGGPTNPFIVFYFVNLALSGVLLSARGAGLLSVAAIMAFALLTYTHQTIAELQDVRRLQSLSELLATNNDWSSLPLAAVGALVAFAASAAVIVNFATKLTAEALVSDRLRRLAEQRRAQAEKLEALGTLAAGAAHELATPLTTIAIAASETQRDLEQAGAASESIADLALIRRELERCRTILNRMSTEAGQATPGSVEAFTAEELIEEVLGELTDPSRIDQQWLVAKEENELSLFAPRTALAQALRAVVQNALDATDLVDSSGRVTVRVARQEKYLSVAIEDHGPGMPTEVLSRAGEPFFTTKEPGRGMGLGLFLTRSVVERLGGSFRLESMLDEGTTATIRLPLTKKS